MRSGGPSIVVAANVFYASSYIVFVAALLLLVKSRDESAFKANVLDASIIATNAAALSWIFLMKPYIDVGGAQVLERILTISYPLGDVFMLAVLVSLMVASGPRPTSYRLFVGALMLLLTSDTAYYLISVADGYQLGGPLDLGWLLAYLLFGAAALHPSMQTLASGGAERQTRLTGRRLVWFAAAALVGPAALVLQAWRRETIDTPLIVGGSVVLFMLVLVRLSGLVRDNESKLQRLGEQDRRLREAEAKYRSLVEHLPAIVYTCVPTEDGDWLYVSPQIESLLGITPDEVLERGLWGPRLHPEDRARVLAEEALSREQGSLFTRRVGPR
ncbi:MAG: PAS domain-containing protein [Actinomycetota bacterium]